MITKKLAGEIWECYREIAAGEKLLADLEKERDEYTRKDEFALRLKDAFGRRRQLQLGVPSGDASHTLYGVSAELGETVIRAHVAQKQARLIELNVQARIEIASDVPP